MTRTPLAIALVIGGLIAIAISLVLSLSWGSEVIPSDQITAALMARFEGATAPDPTVDVIVWELRAPRAVLAVVAGAGLAIAGSTMQTLVRNPLADPYLLGVSAGASVGATAVISIGLFSALGLYALFTGALVGALASAIIVYLIALAQGGLTPLRLVLSGVVLSAAFSALASFLVFKAADPKAAQSVLFWMLGSVAGASWARLLLPTITVVVSLIALLAVSNWLDALAGGPETAAALGVPVVGMRRALFAGISIQVGILVAVSGGIGFVGLIMPHIARLLVGARHRVMVPVCAVAGGLFLLWVDVLSRLIARPEEVPLGVVTGIIGAPVFLILMGRRSYRFSGAAA